MIEIPPKNNSKKKFPTSLDSVNQQPSPHPTFTCTPRSVNAHIFPDKLYLRNVLKEVCFELILIQPSLFCRSSCSFSTHQYLPHFFIFRDVLLTLILQSLETNLYIYYSHLQILNSSFHPASALVLDWPCCKLLDSVCHSNYSVARIGLEKPDLTVQQHILSFGLLSSDFPRKAGNY